MQALQAVQAVEHLHNHKTKQWLAGDCRVTISYGMAFVTCRVIVACTAFCTSFGYWTRQTPCLVLNRDQNPCRSLLGGHQLRVLSSSLNSLSGLLLHSTVPSAGRWAWSTSPAQAQGQR